MKICPMGAELFLADRRADMTKRIVAFPNISKAPKGVSWRDRLKSFSLQHVRLQHSILDGLNILQYFTTRVEIPVL